MTRSEITTQAGRLTGRVDTSFNTTLHGFINQSIREWARKRPWLSLKGRQRLFANGTRHLVLPSYMERPVSIFNVSNSLPVEAGGNWDFEFPGRLADQTVGTPIEWQDMGSVATTRAPTGFVSLASDSDSDTSIDVRLTGFSHVSDSSGTPLEFQIVHETISLTGSSPVTATNLFVSIETISKTDDTTGNVTVTDAAAGRAISRLGPFDPQARFRRLEFIMLPAAGTELEVTFIRQPEELEADTQSAHPSIDEDFLIWNTAGLGLVALGERQAGITFIQKAQQVLDDSDFREKSFGDQFLRTQPLLDGFDEERRLLS